MASEEECPPCEVGAPAWMVTYGDMVTLLLCLFVMLFTTGKATPQEIQIILSAFSNSLGFFTGGQTLSKGRMEEMGMNLESLPSQTQGRSLSRAKKQARSVFVPEIKAKKVRVTEDERGLVVSLVGVDYFAPGSALPTAELEKVLVKASGLIRSIGKFTRIEGHTSKDEDQYLGGTGHAAQGERAYEHSWDLAGARSNNVAVFLIGQGVAPEWLQTVSYGSWRPLVDVGDTGTPEAAAHNRRIDIVIMTHKDTSRDTDESGRGLPDSRLPGSENLIPDT
ncbi:MAG: flagellar motor protein MotB [Leptospiraceae bacterium]|nr:flagellar motor protein MotB [Leptospiraceae bacterium]